jgi:ribosome-associated translation inhibitor RaiA
VVRHGGEGKSLRIDVTSAGVRLTKACRGRVRRRVLLSLARFGPQLQRAAVHLSQSCHSMGGTDQSCRIRARLRSGRVLQAEAVDGQLEGAAGRSAMRLALLVAATCGDGTPGLRDRWPVE